MFDTSGSYCCGCYIVDHYCFMFDRGVVHIVVAGEIVAHYCLRFDRGWFILLWLAILATITAWGLTEEWFILFLGWL